MQVTPLIIQLMQQHKINDIRQMLKIEFDDNLKKSIMRTLMQERFTNKSFEPIYDRNAYFIKHETNKEVILTYISGNIGMNICKYYKTLCKKINKSLIVDYTLSVDFNIASYKLEDLVINDMLLALNNTEYHEMKGLIHDKNLRRNDILIDTDDNLYTFNTQRLIPIKESIKVNDIEYGVYAIQDGNQLFNRKVVQNVL